MPKLQLLRLSRRNLQVQHEGCCAVMQPVLDGDCALPLCRYCFGGGAVVEFARQWPDTPGLRGAGPLQRITPGACICTTCMTLRMTITPACMFAHAPYEYIH